MQKIYRLTQRKSFNYIYRKGKTVNSELMRMYYVPARNLKIGIVVGKKVGNSVIRSRVKRRISERFRLLIPNIKENFNFIVVAKEECAGCESAIINENLVYMLKKIGVYSEK